MLVHDANEWYTTGYCASLIDSLLQASRMQLCLDHDMMRVE